MKFLYLILALSVFLPACDAIEKSVKESSQRAANEAYSQLLDEMVEADASNKTFIVVNAGYHRGILEFTMEDFIKDGWEPVGSIVVDKYGEYTLDVNYLQSLKKVNKDIKLIKENGKYKLIRANSKESK